MFLIPKISYYSKALVVISYYSKALLINKKLCTSSVIIGSHVRDSRSQGLCTIAIHKSIGKGKKIEQLFYRRTSGSYLYINEFFISYVCLNLLLYLSKFTLLVQRRHQVSQKHLKWRALGQQPTEVVKLSILYVCGDPGYNFA